MAQHIESSPLSLTFLGTSAGGGPSPTRNCLATALNLPNESWLVDCAEGTQHMMMRVGQPSPEKVTRVFITRLRIDHMFGLVPLILTKMYAPRSKHVSASNADSPCMPPLIVASLQTRLRIYGPAGLRAFVRNCLSITNTELVGKYEVIELLRDGEQYTPCNKEALHMNEALGRDIIANADGTWPSFETTSDGWTLSAGPLVTSFPGTSMGFIFQEPHITIPPSKDYVALLHCVSETLFPPGLRTHADLLRQLGNGKSVTLAQGRFVLDPFPRIPGRKVVVLGTTSDASPCAELARNADILVHEATVAPIVETWNGIYVDGVRGEKDTARHAIKWGHSTPTMAGQFAHRIGARVLVMNYFGEKYAAPCESVASR
ncbi:hypothetical protein EXIGLDRAFT_606383 [Exidia glandulosa HHB12029]|uniref:Metallo-beta-lactamase domain-containing protein n=1 Tax=Exidia glandulosa HHB12029 TaxID=1314781 RepID=A0A165M7K4_EXIGL|nr:hypothetical protein EXIGLDRAFT_606383 [Exidia glandulosa HHB12029]